MARIEPYLLNLPGEYHVYGELNKRGMFATVTYGNRRGVDGYAMCDRKERALKIDTFVMAMEDILKNGVAS